MRESKSSSRREFIRTTAQVGAGLAIAGRASSRVLGANERIQLALIGCGNRGNHLLSQVLRLSRDQNLEVTALCDVWNVNLRRTASRLEEETGRTPRTTSRYGALLEWADIDAVIIATPDFAHTPILIEAMMAGKDAYVEKPMATRMEHAREALQTWLKEQRIVQVGTQRRSSDLYRRGAEFVQSGVLGKITEIEAGWHDCRPRWARDYSDVRQADVDWDQFQMYLPKRKFSAERFRRWHLFTEYTVGTPGLLGSHLIDVASWFMNASLPASASAHGGIYIWKDGREHADTLDCIIEYPAEYIVNYSTRLGNRFPIHLEDGPIPTTFYGSKGTFDTSSWTARPNGAGEDAITDQVQLAAEEGQVDDVASHVLNWVDCMRSRNTPNAPIQAGYAHSVASIMCFLAWKSGRKQQYDAKHRRILQA